MPAVNFFEEDVNLNLKGKIKLKNWIKATMVAEGYRLTELNYIFCTDDYLLSINRQYLNHDTYTDIITFDNADKKGEITGDIFISAERVKENSIKFGVPFLTELKRVIIHGALHLCGYLDKKPADKKLMTQKEDFYLAKFEA